MITFTEFLQDKGEETQWLFDEKNWLKGAINSAHKGFCSPITKSTCTPHRKALAKRFKHGDLHKSKKED